MADYAAAVRASRPQTPGTSLPGRNRCSDGFLPEAAVRTPRKWEHNVDFPYDKHGFSLERG